MVIRTFFGSWELADSRLLHPCRDVDWLRRRRGQHIRTDRLSLRRRLCSPPMAIATLLLFCPAGDVRQTFLSSVGSRASRSSSFARWHRLRAVEAGMAMTRAATAIVNPSLCTSRTSSATSGSSRATASRTAVCSSAGGVMAGMRSCLPAEAISQLPPPACAPSLVEHDAAGDAEQPRAGRSGSSGRSSTRRHATTTASPNRSGAS